MPLRTALHRPAILIAMLAATLLPVAACSSDPTPTTTTTAKTISAMPPLRPTVEAYARDLSTANSHEKIITLLNTYASPTCAKLRTEAYISVEGATGSRPTHHNTVTTVTQNGATGTSTLDVPGTPSLIDDWNYADGAWKFNCKRWLAGLRETETATETDTATPAPTPPPTTTTTPASGPAPGDTCDESQIGTFNNGLRCTLMGGSAAPRWVSTAGG